MIGQTIARYHIVEKLGEGGMGVVYKTKDTKLARRVALKFLGTHLLGNAEAAALHHPNICTVYEIDEAEGRTFIAMAFVEGEGLEQRIARGPLPIQEALDIGQPVATGLQAAHEKGILHRERQAGLARLMEASRLTRPTPRWAPSPTCHWSRPGATRWISAATCGHWACCFTR